MEQIVILGAVLVAGIAIEIFRGVRERRRSRRRDELKHVVGIRPWWGGK